MTRKSNTKITATIEELIRLYQAGNTLKQIGEKFGASREAVRQHFERAGIVTIGDKKSLRVARTKHLKPLAEDILIESCNRKVKEEWVKRRRVEHALLEIKKSRITLINGVDKTLKDIQKTCDLGLSNKKQSLLALKVIQELVNKQAEEFEKYKNKMNSYNTKEY